MTAFIAIDISKNQGVVCIRDQDNMVREVSTYANTSYDASEFAKRALEKYGECKAVVESTGSQAS